MITIREATPADTAALIRIGESFTGGIEPYRSLFGRMPDERVEALVEVMQQFAVDQAVDPRGGRGRRRLTACSSWWRSRISITATSGPMSSSGGSTRPTSAAAPDPQLLAAGEHWACRPRHRVD